jgi:predicted neutral ceramidase superfamily lipid hydrolase
MKSEIIGTRTIDGVYGIHEEATDVIICDLDDDTSWYVCRDSVNVNRCYTEELNNIVNVELVMDVDMLTSDKEITSESQLRAIIEELLDDE